MLKLWPSSPQPLSLDSQLTPKPQKIERNPFESVSSDSRTPPAPDAHQQQHQQPPTPTGTSFHHRLLSRAPPSPIGPGRQLGATDPAVGTSGDVTPLGSSQLQPQQNLHPSFAAALPTTQLSLNAPEFNMSSPPRSSKRPAPDLSPAPSPSPAPAGPNASKGKIHVKLIQARGLNVPSPNSRPYVVVTYDQSEFVSRDPTDETDKEVRGVPTRNANGATTPVNPPPNSSSSALAALGKVSAAIDKATNGTKSNNTSPVSSLGSGKSDKSLFGRLSAHNPVWKHEVALCVVILATAAAPLTKNLQRRHIVEVAAHVQRL